MWSDVKEGGDEEHVYFGYHVDGCLVGSGHITEVSRQNEVDDEEHVYFGYHVDGCLVGSEHFIEVSRQLVLAVYVI